MKNRWMLLLTVLALCLPFAACAQTMYIDGVTADRVHLRLEPSETAESLGLYFTGTPVERLTWENGGWTRVRIGTQTGYMRQTYLAERAEECFPLMVVNNTTSDWVNLRAGASFDAAVIGRVNNGEPVRLMGETASGWSYVHAAGRQGYIVTDFLAAVEEGGSGAATQIVGTTPDGGYIHACEVGAGEFVYFVATEPDPEITMEDVNFDGQTDLVFTTVRGATNLYFEFFVWTPQGYVRAEYPVATGIANYRLDPDRGYVVSSANGGSAGALYEDFIFRWEGTSLRTVRCAVSESLHEYRSEGNSFTTTVSDRKIMLTVYAYDENGDGTLIHEEIINLGRMDADKLNEMKQRLWQGLR